MHLNNIRPGYYTGDPGMFKHSSGYYIYDNNVKFIFYDYIDNTKYEVTDVGIASNSNKHGRSIQLPFNVSKVLTIQVSRIDWTDMVDLCCMYSPIKNRIDVFNLSDVANDTWLGFNLIVEAII